MSSRQTNDIKALSERLGSLQITNKFLEDYKQIDIKISTAIVPVTINRNV